MPWWAKFFYCPDATEEEENLGIEEPSGLPPKSVSWDGQRRKNLVPVAKSITLMRFLCRLVTPPGVTVLDPYMGSGTTGIAAIMENIKFVGIEREKDYYTQAKQRLAAAEALP